MSEPLAIVTGAGGGLGRAICARLLRDRYRVIALDKDRSGLASLTSAANGVVPIEFNLLSIDAVPDLISEIQEAHGPHSLLVNNAGFDRPRPFLDTDPEDWHMVVSINFLAGVALCHASYAALTQTKGSIVSVASDAARVGSKGEAVYSGAKSAVIGFTKTLAREWAREGIRANVVSPGPTRTPLLAQTISERPRLIEAMEKLIPLGRIGEPEEVANAIVFLGSDQASYITGQVLSVSGGLTMVG